MSKRLKLGQMLVDAGVLTPARLEEALNAQLIYGGKLGTNLVELGFVTEEFLTGFLSQQCKMPAVGGHELEDIPLSVIQALTSELADRHRAVPFRKEKRRLDVAILDPTNLETLDELAFMTGCSIRPHVAPEVSLVRALERYYGIPLAQRYIRIVDDTSSSSAAHAAPAAARPVAPIELPAPPPAPAPIAQPAHTVNVRHPSHPEVAAYPPPAHPAPAHPAPAHPASAHPAPAHPASAHPAEPAAVALPIRSALAEAIRLLQQAESNQKVIEAVLHFSRPFFSTRVVFALRAESFELIVQEGAQRLPPRALSVPIRAPNIFFNVAKTKGYHVGPMPPHADNTTLLEQLGQDSLSTTFVAPLIYQNRAEIILLGVGLHSSFSLEHIRCLQLVLEKASLALQILSLRKRLAALPEDLR